MYSTGTTEISHLKKHDLADTLFEILEGWDLELFWSGFKELRLQNLEIERKLICSNAHYSLIIFVLPPAF